MPITEQNRPKDKMPGICKHFLQRDPDTGPTGAVYELTFCMQNPKDTAKTFPKCVCKGDVANCEYK